MALKLRLIVRGVLAAAVATVLVSCGEGGTPAEPLSAAAVATSSGTFKGLPARTPDVTVFKGIRYAAAPVGPLRWKPPQAAPRAEGLITADTFGAACPQQGGAMAQSEDCLFLNVFAPSAAKRGSNLPVLVFIHGGAFLSGTGAAYDATSMVAENNVIVVTLNYRLGALGLIVMPGLLATEASRFENIGDGGNYGFIDQQFAFQWLRDNVAAFGGDPSKVTITGESAGGQSVFFHLASPETAQGLFRGVISQSSGSTYNTLPSKSEFQDKFAEGFARDIGCAATDAECLRGKPVEAILESQNRALGRYNWSPVHGTKALPLSFKAAFQSGKIVKVPVINGTTAHEGRFFLPGQLPRIPAEQAIPAGGPATYLLAHDHAFCGTEAAPSPCTYPALINRYLGSGLAGTRFAVVPPTMNTPEFGQKLADTYPMANFPNPYLDGAPNADMALGRLFTDMVMACNAQAANGDLAASGIAVFSYEFDDPNAPPRSAPVQPPNNVLGYPSGPEHTSELQYLYESGQTFTPEQSALAREMRAYWANFATSLDPNGQGLPAFKPFPAVQRLVPGGSHASETFDQDHHCTSLWSPILTGSP